MTQMKVTIFNIEDSEGDTVRIFYTKREALKAIQELKKQDKENYLELKEEIGEDIVDYEPIGYRIVKEVFEGNMKSIVKTLIHKGIAYSGGTAHGDELDNWYCYEQKRK